jgi:hypothetical protein
MLPPRLIRASRALATLGLLALAVACPNRRADVERFHRSSRVGSSDFPDAKAVVLLDRTELTFSASESGNPYAEEVHTRRVQILDKGALNLQRVLIPFDARSRILQIQGRLLRQNGGVDEMPADLGADVERFNAGSKAAALYNDDKGYKLTRVSGAEVGDVVEITYVRVLRDPRWVEPISVGGDLPCVRGEVVINHPSGFDIDFRVTQNGSTIAMRPNKFPTRIQPPGAPKNDDEGGVAGTRHSFVFNTIPAVFTEGQNPEPSALTTQVHVQLRSMQIGAKRRDLYRDFDDVAAWYRELTRGSDVPDSAVVNRARSVERGASKQQKIERVQRLLQDQIDDVPSFLNLAALPAHPPREILEAGIGDAKDQASLGLALLRALGIDGFPVLVSRLGSFASVPDLPTPAPFNHVVIAIPAGGSYAFIDPSTHALPTGRLPGALQGQKGLLVRADRAELVDLPEDTANENTSSLELELDLDEEGVARGQLIATLEGLDAASAREILRLRGPDMRKRMRALLLEEPGDDAGFAFDVVARAQTGTDRADEPLKLQIALAPTRIATRVGDRLELTGERLLGRPLSFLWREARRSPVVLANRSISRTKISVKLPAKMGVGELPQTFKRDAPLVASQLEWAIADGVLWANRVIRLDERIVPAERYVELRDPLTALWMRAQTPIRVMSGGNRGQSYDGDPF